MISLSTLAPLPNGCGILEKSDLLLYICSYSREDYPSDPNIVDWSYTQGTQLRDFTLKELADYYGRLVSWYTKGGFTDEYGVYHHSGYYYHIPYWFILKNTLLYSL